MKRLLTTAGLAAPLLLCSCVPSLHPLYTEKDVIFDPALVGQWSEDGSDETWTFTKRGEKTYNLLYREGTGKTGEFVVHLMKVDGRLFLDLFPAVPEIDTADFYKFHLLPAHTFLIVRQIEPTLQMAMIDPDWAKMHLKKHPEALKHEVLEKSVVFTAQPKELQAFLIKHAEGEGLFGEYCDMARKPKPEKQQEEKAEKKEKEA